NSPSGVTVADSGHIFVSTLDVPGQGVADYIPGVQLSPAQSGQVAVSNNSTTPINTTINVTNADGSIFMTKAATVQPNKTFVFAFRNSDATAVYRTVVTTSVANSIVCDFQVFASNSELSAVVLPQQHSGKIQNTPSVRLVPGQ